ncbi:hypothetical protein SANA_15310 [Gottschalkiaceae bacterium SANA]|nr:hypothetical protein SANA_15310 [Gottschalkiaceae bacterium SANA]
MPLSDFIKEKITGKPAKINGPMFLKETSDAKKQLEMLRSYRQTCPKSVQKEVDRDIKFLSYGIYGESQVAYELRNCFLPIIILHDLHIVYKGLEAQIDYLIVTQYEDIVIECKNLIGNIEVNAKGDFIRTTNFNGSKKREGIYSPITQNQRHLQLLKKIAIDRQSNIVMRKGVNYFFEEAHKSIIVLANPKTIVNLRVAKKEVKDQIIRCDQLNAYLKKMASDSKVPKSSGEEMFKIASRYLDLHQPNRKDYTKKYSAREDNHKSLDTKKGKTEELKESKEVYANTQGIREVLKAYRYNKSKEEGVKAYYIYSNAQMEALMVAKPKTTNEIMKIKGFGRVKCDKYGEDLIRILREYKE